MINSLLLGGAETFLCRLIEATGSIFQHDVLMLQDAGRLRERARGAATSVTALTLRSLAQVCRRGSFDGSGGIDVVQGWMYHGNLAATAVAASARKPLIWNIRCSLQPLSYFKLSTRLVIAALRSLSSLPDAIIYNSERARAEHRHFGFDDSRAVTIPNGIDVERFRPDGAAKASIRGSLGIPPEALVILHAARYDRMKDHRGFLRAAAAVMAERGEVWCVMCGEGVDERNSSLTKDLRELGLGGRCMLLGAREDVPALMAASDVFVSSSSSEGFSNALAEACASALPCVTTDVGDSARIVGPYGIVVPPRNVEALAAAIDEVLSWTADRRAATGLRAREHIEENFGLKAVARAYEDLWRNVVVARRRKIA